MLLRVHNFVTEEEEKEEKDKTYFYGCGCYYLNLSYLWYNSMWWYFTKLNSFTNLLNLMQYSSRGGQENHLGWCLDGFLVHHSLNILKVTLKVMKYHLVASWSTLGCASCTSGCHSVILHYFSCYFSEIPPQLDFRSSISDSIVSSHVAFSMNQEEVSAAVKYSRKWANSALQKSKS